MHPGRSRSGETPLLSAKKIRFSNPDEDNEAISIGGQITKVPTTSHAKTRPRADSPRLCSFAGTASPSPRWYASGPTGGWP
jgi:hypothetical protein